MRRSGTVEVDGGDHGRIVGNEAKEEEGNGGGYQMLVLDEIMAVMKYEIISVDEMLDS